MSTVLLALSSSLLFAAPALTQSTGTGSCTDVHIFLGKGWNSRYDNQRQTQLVDAICNDLGSDVSCDYEDIILNNLEGTEYCPAVEEGDQNGKQQITAYAQKCPESKLVLSGYSQGANVVGDIIAGGGGGGSDCASTAPLDPSSDAVCQIAAVMLFGDPRHTANAAYNAGTGVAGQGEFPRTAEQLDRLNSYGNELRSWCARDDPNCAKDLGLNTVEAHTNYFTYVTSEAASWAVSKIQAASGSCGQVSSSSTSSMSSTSSTKAAVSSSMSTSESSSAPATTSADATTSAAATTSAGATTSADATTSTVMPTMTASMNGTGNATASYQPTASATVTTMISGKPACISYSTSTSVTTYGPFPPWTVKSPVPVTTSYIGWGNGTATFTSAVGSGTAAASGTGSGVKPTGSGVTPFTGAANNVQVAGGLVAGVMGLVGFMMM
ncbi:hypothetical protein D0862_01097 [Hortaea werneckii]|uniref:Cutinase n=1 Tax=Hortaea werneckii TaxID=91943 RepID=A0A3M7HTX7_HORWE|nr:hypothetical protein D0862_01097 [Hortaea werneckii]